MRKLLIITLTVFTTIQAYSSRKQNVLSEQKNLEAGVGVGLFFGDENTNFYRLQANTRDLFFDRLGVYYTLELSGQSSLPNTDLIGLSCRLNSNFSVQTAAGLFCKYSIFKSKNFRKEVSFVYHPISSPLTYTIGYSKQHGPTLTLNFKIFRSDSVEKK